MDTEQNTITTISYTTVEQFIENFEQKRKEIKHTLTLEEGTVKSNSLHFKLEQVDDISFKNFSTGGGHLYLHTDQGVFSFIVSIDPTYFIHSFRKIKWKNHYIW